MELIFDETRVLESVFVGDAKITFHDPSRIRQSARTCVVVCPQITSIVSLRQLTSRARVTLRSLFKVSSLALYKRTQNPTTDIFPSGIRYTLKIKEISFFTSVSTVFLEFSSIGRRSVILVEKWRSSHRRKNVVSVVTNSHLNGIPRSKLPIEVTESLQINTKVFVFNIETERTRYRARPRID